MVTLSITFPYDSSNLETILPWKGKFILVYKNMGVLNKCPFAIVCYRESNSLLDPLFILFKANKISTIVSTS